MDPALSLDEYAQFFTYNGLGYPLTPAQTLVGDREEVPNSFSAYVSGVYKSNGVVFACMLARLLLFSEMRFQFRRVTNGRPGDLFGTKDLSILETPWSGATTGDLLTRAIQDVDLAGNFYVHRTMQGQLRRLRPDWVSIVLGSQYGPEDGAVPGDLNAEVLGYAYQPGGPYAGRDVLVLPVDTVAHFAPIPDPIASYRGMSWVTPVLREVMGDSAANTHKLRFFENGASVNMVVTMDPGIKQEAFNRWIRIFEQGHQGALNAYKTLYLGGGADVKSVGSNFQQMDFKVTQGAGETRIAAAAGVPPVIVGLSEGLSAATYSNYSQARRRFADGTMRPLWRNMAGSMARIINAPTGAELWYDDRDIAFLRVDEQDRAQILTTDATTMVKLVQSGWEPDSVVAAVQSGDFSKLVHTGLYSVQLQPPGTTMGSPDSPPPAPPAPPPTGSSSNGHISNAQARAMLAPFMGLDDVDI